MRGRPSSTALPRTSSPAPAHPYTWGLLGSMPRLDRERGDRLIPIKETPPSLINVPPGCSFHPRCRYADLTGGRSAAEVPLLPETSPGHLSACHLPAAQRRRIRAEEIRPQLEGAGQAPQASSAPQARWGGNDMSAPLRQGTTAPATPTAAGRPADALLAVTGLRKYFPVTRGITFRHQVGAVQARTAWTSASPRGRRSAWPASRAAARRPPAACLPGCSSPPAGESFSTVTTSHTCAPGRCARCDAAFR